MPKRLCDDWRQITAAFWHEGDPELTRMYEAATAYITDIHDGAIPHWLTFLGPSGTGKTMLATMTMRFIRKHLLHFSPGYGITLTRLAISAKWPLMVSEMKNGDFGTVENFTEKEMKWDHRKDLTHDFALIDDIGQIEDAQKSYLIGALGRIADARLRSWTIWTSNLHIGQIAEIVDPRIASRMIRDGNVIVETKCQDYNLR